jgi:hypothetical protein
MTIIKDEVFDSLNPNIQGFVDNCDYQVVTGWLIDFSNVNRYLSLKVLIDGVEVCRALADRYRSDLAENVVFNQTCHAYNIKIPFYIADGKEHEINIVEVENNYVLNGSPLKVIFPKNNVEHGELKMDVALVGKDGWLFLCNDSNDAIGQFTGEVKMSPEIIEHYKKHYQSIQEFYRSKNIYYLMTIAPGKESLYSEFLPDTVVASHSLSVKDQFNFSINPLLENNILDLLPILLANKSCGQLCYKTDSHWNYLGAMIAVENIIQKLRERFPRIPEFNKKNFTLIYDHEGRCDLSEKKRLNYVGGQFVENNEKVEVSISLCAVNVKYDNDVIEILEHPYQHLSKTRPTRLFKHKSNTSLPRAIFIRDSYADWMIPFFNGCFSECLFVWARKVDSDVVESFNPDIIIEQVVDRFLAQNRLLPKKTIPPVLYGISSFVPDMQVLKGESNMNLDKDSFKYVLLSTPTSAAGSLWRIVNTLFPKPNLSCTVVDYYLEKGIKLDDISKYLLPQGYDIYLFNQPQDLSGLKFIINLRDPRDLICNMYYWIFAHPVPAEQEEHMTIVREKIKQEGINSYCIKNDISFFYKTFFEIMEKVPKENIYVVSYAQVCLISDQVIDNLAKFINTDLSPDEINNCKKNEFPSSLQGNPNWTSGTWIGSDLLPGRARVDLDYSTFNLLTERYAPILEFLAVNDLKGLSNIYR